MSAPETGAGGAAVAHSGHAPSKLDLNASSNEVTVTSKPPETEADRRLRHTREYVQLWLGLALFLATFVGCTWGVFFAPGVTDDLRKALIGIFGGLIGAVAGFMYRGK